MQKIKVFIADTHSLAREGLKSILCKRDEIAIVGEATTSTTLRETIKKIDVDIVIIDFNIPDYFSTEDIVFLKKNHPSIDILIISSSQNVQDVLYTLDLDINGYLLKECDEDEIGRAVFAISKGEKFFCSKVVDIILEKHIHKKQKETANPSPLSQREHEIVQLFSEGLPAKEIAQKLFLSHHTINTHRKNILKKLKVNSTTELVLYALRFGMISAK